MRALHPSFRRIFALGSVPTVAARRLGQSHPVLAALAREFAPLAGLAAGALLRALDLTAVLDVAGRRPREDSAGDWPGAASDAASIGVDSRSLRPPRSPERRPRSTGAPPGKRTGRFEVASHVVRDHDAPAVAALLERHAPRDWRTWALSQTARGKSHDDARSTSGAVHARSTATPRPTVTGPVRVGRASGRAWVDARAARAGVPEAADLPVQRLRSSDPERLLTGVMSEPSFLAEATTPTSGGAPRAAPTGPGVLTRTLGRLDTARHSAAAKGLPRRTPARVADRGSARDAGAVRVSDGSAPLTRATGGHAAEGDAVAGLRGLAVRLSAAQCTGGWDGASPPPSPALPDVVAERMRETDLGDRLAALLRREAHRAGIDVGGVGP